ncbi:MAG TPA: peroxide stress protein YaaA, partial [Porticoccaceae bacterium]|nr:peroxide stress protein YaaA [Porticoccaceae bacterium]
MLAVISPAKKLDYSSSVSATAHTQPALLKHSQELLEGLKQLSPQDI